MQKQQNFDQLISKTREVQEQYREQQKLDQGHFLSRCVPSCSQLGREKVKEATEELVKERAELVEQVQSLKDEIKVKATSNLAIEATIQTKNEEVFLPLLLLPRLLIADRCDA